VNTAIDTNILLDIFLPDPQYKDTSREALFESGSVGLVTLAEPVYTELSAHFSSRQELDQALDQIGVVFQPSSTDALFAAGRAWQDYARRRPSSMACPSCGSTQDVRCAQCGTPLNPRQHVLADFIIGANALLHADRLLTRDRGFYRTYFRGLKIV